MSYNSKYFDRKPGSLENAVLEALGGQINEASVTTDLDDDPKLFKQIERMGVKVKKNGKPQDGYQEVTLSGPQAKIDAANKKLNLLPEAKDMDKVNPDAVKKKFKDRKDKDIDNDGDVDSSDEYLHKRRKAISKAVKSEEVELDEGKMKELAGKIASVYMKMKKDKEMKSFADKFRADVKKSLDIRKSLEKVLPDYVGGGDITKLMSEGKLDELSPALLRRARDAAQAKADKLGGREDKLSQKKGGGYNFKSKSGQKLSRDADKARDQQRRFEKGASDAAGREQEKADQKGVLGKKGTSAKSKEKERRRGVEPRGDSGRQKGSLAGVGRNVDKVDALYKKYRDGGGKLSKSDYLDKFGSRIKKEATELGTPERTKHTLDVTPGQSMEDWNKAVGVMQEKNDTMRETLVKMWSVEEGRNHNPFGEAADFKPHKMYDPKTGEAHDAKTMDDHLRMKKMGYTHTSPKKEQKTMTGQPTTKVTVDPDMKEKVRTETAIGKKNIA